MTGARRADSSNNGTKGRRRIKLLGKRAGRGSGLSVLRDLCLRVQMRFKYLPKDVQRSTESGSAGTADDSRGPITRRGISIGTIPKRHA